MAVKNHLFEVIQPFSDDKVRSGRVILLPYLKLEKQLATLVIYRSKYSANNKAKYGKK